MAIHSSTIAWKTPRTEELGRLQSMESQRVRHDRATSLLLSLLLDWLLSCICPNIPFESKMLGLSHSFVSNTSRPHGLKPSRLLGPWNFPDKNTGVGSLWLLWGNLPNPVIEPRSPTLQVDSLPAEPQGKSPIYEPSKEVNVRLRTCSGAEVSARVC